MILHQTEMHHSERYSQLAVLNLRFIELNKIKIMFKRPYKTLDMLVFAVNAGFPTRISVPP